MKNTTNKIDGTSYERSNLLKTVLRFALRKTASTFCKNSNEQTNPDCITLSQACLGMKKNHYQVNTDQNDRWCCFTYASSLQWFEKSSNWKYIPVLKTTSWPDNFSSSALNAGSLDVEHIQKNKTDRWKDFFQIHSYKRHCSRYEKWRIIRFIRKWYCIRHLKYRAKNWLIFQKRSFPQMNEDIS